MCLVPFINFGKQRKTVLAAEYTIVLVDAPEQESTSDKRLI